MTSVSETTRNPRGRPFPNFKEKKIIRYFILKINNSCETACSEKRMLNISPESKSAESCESESKTYIAGVNCSGKKGILKTFDKTVECSRIMEPAKAIVAATGTIDKVFQPPCEEVDLRAESSTKHFMATEGIQDVNINLILDPTVRNENLDSLTISKALDSNAVNNAFVSDQNALISGIDVTLSGNIVGDELHDDLSKELHQKNVFFDGSLCDDSGNCSIHLAVITGDCSKVCQQWKVLNSRGLSLDLKNDNAQTPLHLAVQFGDSCMTLLLLKLGADPTVKDGEGNTALHLSIPKIENDNSLFKCFELIMKTDNLPRMINSFNNRGFSPLHEAAFYGAYTEATMIIQAGAQIDLKDRLSGRTPLFLSVEESRTDIMRLLLKNGADCMVKNMAGQTPHMAAIKLLAIRLNQQNKKKLKRKFSETS